MSNLNFLILITMLAGSFGTGLGGLLGCLFPKNSHRSISFLLSFASGIMLSIVCFDLILDALTLKLSFQNVYLIIAGIILGVCCVYLINYAFPFTNQQNTLLTAGIITACAISLHNLPEGMSIGASFAHDLTNYTSKSGLLLALLIGFHNIPEGMTISVPLTSAGMKNHKAVLISFLSGLPTSLGGICGYSLGCLGNFGLVISLSFASGAMFYVVFGEILPQATFFDRSKFPAFFVILGILLGLFILYH